jgi:K+/H+ antiporter YhaU regulatory subunit KhtT
VGLKNKAVPLGIMRADGKLILSPSRGEMLKLDAGDHVVVFADCL